MRLPSAGLILLLLAACAMPQPEPCDPSPAEAVAEPEGSTPEVVVEPKPAPQGDYAELMIAALDGFCGEEFESSEANAAAALRLRPDDQLAKDLCRDSRLAVYWGYSHLEEVRRRYRRVRADFAPP